MDREVRHPRVIGAIRALLSVGLAIGLGILALSVVGFLFVLVGIGGVAVLAGVSVDALSLLGVAGVAIVLAGTVGVGLVYAFRWADQRIVEADKRPDPVDELAERYVAADLDEHELERRLGHVLADERSEAEYE